MTPQLLLQHFDRIGEAPDAIPRLRRFILDLAVRGKLVEQEPRDEPASELLKLIQAEKERLVSSGEIKKEKSLPAIEVEEIPFAILAKWEWVRLKSITSYIQRGKSPKYAPAEGLPVISQKCVQWDGLDFDSAKLITPESIKKYEPIRFLRSGDLLWNSTGTGTIGRIIKVSEPPPKLVCDSHVTVVRCLKVDAEYVRSWLRSDHVYGMIEDRAAGSTNQVELTSQMAMNQVVPLPPLAEQHRIVAKVYKLMALCDRLEAAQTERENRRDRLVASSLHRLNNGAGAVAFREHARFYFNHLQRLTTRPQHIKQLRQSILNLAVMGKLVRQDPSEEVDYDQVTSKMADEKKEYHQRKGVRLQKFKEIPDIQFELKVPTSWAIVYFEQVIKYITDFQANGSFAALKKNVTYYDVPNFALLLRLTDLRHRLKDSRNYKYTDEAGYRFLSKSAIEGGELVIANVGAGVGTTLMVPEIRMPATLAPNMFMIVLSELIDKKYFLYFSQSPAYWTYIEQVNTGTGQPKINKSEYQNCKIPLPPLAEQHRIVAKVDELMALCDQLETQLTTTQSESQKLMEALLHEALLAEQLQHDLAPIEE